MFQLIAVVGVTFVIATVLTRIVLGRSIGDLLRDGLRGEVEPETPTEQLTRRRREAARRRLVMEADGALETRLGAYITTQKAWASAYAQRPVPSLVMGGNGAGDTDGQTADFTQMMQLLVAKELGLDLGLGPGR